MQPTQTAMPLFNEQRPYIKGTLIHEIFHNPENAFTISKIKVTEATEQLDDAELTIVGVYPSLLESEVYTFWGQMNDHPRFGRQYKLDYFRKEMPQGRAGLQQYLSSNLFPGIGPKTATQIIDVLGEQAIQHILEDASVLAEVPMLNDKTRTVLYERLMEHQGLEQIMIKLGEYGIGLFLAVQIFQTYKERAMDVLQENPYQLIEDVDGIGFKRADQIARAMGIDEDSPERIRATCLFYLRDQSEKNGHVYMPQDTLIEEVFSWLVTDGADQSVLTEQTEEEKAPPTYLTEKGIHEQVMHLAQEEKCMLEDERLYIPSLFFAEKAFAKKVSELLQNTRETRFTEQEFSQALGALEERLNIQYAPTQQEAVQKALHTSMLVLTGGPGTGKTTVIKGICEMYAALHECSLKPADYAGKDDPFPILLVAPTGRAAKRMEEATGIPALTIHRLLGWQGGQAFEHSEDHPVPGKLIIIDECSMMDQWLANQLFRALPAHMQVVLVGDQDQLPSVGPGQVLKDLLDSETIPVVELTDIFRQAQDSSVISLAHSIKKGQCPPDIEQALADRRFFPADGPQIVQIVRQVCMSALRKGYTTRDIQVLAPMYRGYAGIDALNNALQEEFNPPAQEKREIHFRELVFRVGDKVLQLVNNPEQHVFNGDIGMVDAIVLAGESKDREERLIVRFDDNEVSYKKNDLTQLTLAYCCSIHKAQGSEFPIVVLPVINQYHRMLKRNLIYTAITRCKQYLILCGQKKALEQAIGANEVQQRFTHLKEELQARFAIVDEA